MHFADRAIGDWRCAIPRPEEATPLDVFFRALLNRGVLIANNWLFALSTPTGDCEVEQFIGDCDSTIGRLVAAPA